MICIKRKDSENGNLQWTAEDADGVIGQITVKAGTIPRITQLEFEQAEIGDGLIKTAAAFFASAGVPKMCFDVESQQAREAASAAGFISTNEGLVIDPARVYRSCKGY